MLKKCKTRTRCVSRLSELFLSTNIFCLSARNSEKRIAKVLARCSQNSVQSGTPDCPVVHRTVFGALGWTPVNRPLSGKVWRHTTIIHRTVWWYTAPTVDCANGRQRNQQATRGLSQRLVGAPDCPLCTEQCPVSQEDRCSNGQLSLIWKEIAHRTCYMTCPVVHRTVQCATRQKANIAFQKEFQRLLAPWVYKTDP
jgi:hypothetical protein